MLNNSLDVNTNKGKVMNIDSQMTFFHDEMPTLKNRSINIDINSASVKTEWITIQEFFEIADCPFQRDTESRVEHSLRYLSKFRDEHLDIHVAELTCDVKYKNQNYFSGFICILNGHTRREVWKRKLSNKIPSHVRITKYFFDSIEEIKNSYDTFDSSESVEHKSDKIFGILKRIFGFTATNKKIKDGRFISALNISNHYYNPNRFSQSTLFAEDLVDQIENYIEEIKAFDSIAKNPKNWDQALIASALMSLKRYGTKNERLLEGLKRIDSQTREIPPDSKFLDGITHLNEEWMKPKEKRKIVRGNNWDQLRISVSYTLYWIKQWMENKKLEKYGGGWKDTASKFFPTYGRLNDFLDISNK